VATPSSGPPGTRRSPKTMKQKEYVDSIRRANYLRIGHRGKGKNCTLRWRFAVAAPARASRFARIILTRHAVEEASARFLPGEDAKVARTCPAVRALTTCSTPTREQPARGGRQSRSHRFALMRGAR